jgi:hypothetical protein
MQRFIINNPEGKYYTSYSTLLGYDKSKAWALDCARKIAGTVLLETDNKTEIIAVFTDKNLKTCDCCLKSTQFLTTIDNLSCCDDCAVEMRESKLEQLLNDNSQSNTTNT